MYVKNVCAFVYVSTGLDGPSFTYCDKSRIHAPLSTAFVSISSTIALGRPLFAPEYWIATCLLAVVDRKPHSVNPLQPLLVADSDSPFQNVSGKSISPPSPRYSRVPWGMGSDRLSFWMADTSTWMVVAYRLPPFSNLSNTSGGYRRSSELYTVN